MSNRHWRRPFFCVKCLHVLVGMIRFCSGERTLFHNLTTQELAFRFVTSIVLGIAYGQCISDLKDDMVNFNYNTSLGERYETFPEQHDSVYSQSSSGGFWH
jgi:hypothetical protein